MKGNLEEIKTKKFDFYLAGLSNDALCCEINYSCVVGSVLNQPHRLIIITDKRQECKSVVFICADPKDSKKIYWKQKIEVFDQHAPIAMFHVITWCNGQRHVLFACGRSVFIAHLHLAESVESVSVINFANLANCTWITSIYANRSDDILQMNFSFLLMHY